MTILDRGFTGHEHLPEFMLINMNARMYDPVTARFLSPDPYVSAPESMQGYNRYAYCFNNPLIYTDPDGELAWFYWVGAALVGGVTNLVSNWKNVDGFWDGLATFGVGAGAAVGIVATGGSGAAALVGTAGAGGALVGASNNVVAQTGKNFSGFNDVNWGQVGVNAAVGGVAGAASAGAGIAATNMGFLVNGVSSPILRSAVVSPLAAGAGHVAGGTTANLFMGQNLGDAFSNSFDGIGKSMAIGGAIGITTTTVYSLTNNINPLNGRELNKRSWTPSYKETTKWNYGDHKSQAKWENQMNQRGWSEQQINESILNGKSYPAQNNINPTNGATRYVHPTTGRSIVVDNVTGRILHVGGDGFKY
jgi:RHS repeat-associated protein